MWSKRDGKGMEKRKRKYLRPARTAVPAPLLRAMPVAPGPSPVLLLLLVASGAGGAMQVSVSPSPLRARPGSDVLLGCNFSMGTASVDLKQLVVQWRLMGHLVAQYDNNLSYIRDGARLFLEWLQHGNASLLLPRVGDLDSGIYTCSVIYTQNQQSGDMELRVEAAPRISIPKRSSTRLIETSFPCHVWGFYPRDITITWLKNGQVLTESTCSTPQRNPDGTFNLTLTYTFTPVDWDRGNILTCRVSHLALTQPLQEEFPLVVTWSVPDIVMAVCMILILLVVAAICLFLYVTYEWKRLKKGKQAPYSVSKVLGLKRCFLGQEVTLNCSMVGMFPEDTAVMWEWLHREDRMMIGTDGVHEAGEWPEEQPLLKSRFQDWRVTEKRSGTCLMASLTFTPTVQDDGARIRCSFHHEAQGLHEQRESREIRLWAWPEVSQIEVLPQGEDLDAVRLAVQIQNFYPATIHCIEWCWDGGGSWKDETPETSQNPDLTFNATSICSIPSQTFSDPEFRVRVLVQQTTRNPKVWREITARDTGRRLCYQISDIRGLEGCLLGQKVTLSCSMGGTFPENMAVTWERIHGEDRMVIGTNGGSETEERPEKELLLHPEPPGWTVTELQSKNMLISFLTFTPTVQDDGARVRCCFHHEAQGIHVQRESDTIKVSGAIIA